MNGAVLITGGLGYVGGRIAKTLISSDSYSEVRLGIRDTGVDFPKEISGCSRTLLNLDDNDSLNNACAGIESIIHLAALNENDSFSNPELALITNGVGSLRLLKAAECASVKRFIYFSTAHVYGAPLIGKISEATIPRPVHPYAITHRTAEDFVLSSRDRGAFNGIVVRLSNSFGAPLTPNVNRWTLLVNDLCRQAVETGSLELSSPGIQERDFITLSDVGNAVDHLLDLSYDVCGDGIFNLGGNNSFKIIEMANRISDRCDVVLGFKPSVIRPQPRDSQYSYSLDYRIDKLLDTGFILKNDIDAEIDETLLFCKQTFGRELS
jgi:UDP-glucose 4-epimerase